MLQYDIIYPNSPMLFFTFLVQFCILDTKWLFQWDLCSVVALGGGEVENGMLREGAKRGPQNNQLGKKKVNCQKAIVKNKNIIFSQKKLMYEKLNEYSKCNAEI